MKIETFEIEGLVLITPRVFADERGFFLESYQAERYRQAGIDCDFVQDNHSRSVKDTIRGMHYQSGDGQAKLVRVGLGKIYDVVVDIRPDSATYGKWIGVELDADKHQQLFVPVGFAHGFCVLSDIAEVLYKVSTLYKPETECGFSYASPDVGIKWPTKTPIVSERDRIAPEFSCVSG